MTHVRIEIFGVVAILSACSAGRGRDFGGEAGGTGPFGDEDGTVGEASVDDAADVASSGEGGDAGGDSTAAADDEGPILDVGPLDPECPAGDCPPTDSCGAVDVLFVIDNSGSMFLYQNALAQAFPTFADAMFSELPQNTDLHVAVTTSSFELGGPSHSETNCVPGESDATIDANYRRPTEGMAGDAGNGLQGRLVDWQALSFYAANTGDAAALPGLKAWFTAAGTDGVRQAGSAFEFNAAAAAWAVHPANDEWNEGFLRDEGAVLVVVIMSDEGDQSYIVESADFLHDTVVDAKAGCGGEACIVTAGLLSPYCDPGTSNSLVFLSSFGADPMIGDITGGNILAPDPTEYTQVVGAALASVVAEACDEIEPAG
jgi:hypothetical protein